MTQTVPVNLINYTISSPAASALFFTGRASNQQGYPENPADLQLGALQFDSPPSVPVESQETSFENKKTQENGRGKHFHIVHKPGSYGTGQESLKVFEASSRGFKGTKFGKAEMADTPQDADK